MRILLVGYFGFFTEGNKACGSIGASAIALVRIGFNDWAFVNQRMMARLIRVWVIRVVGVRHICTDEKTLRKCA